MTDGLDQVHALVGVVILAGGASSRMGTAKAKLLLPTGETLLDYHVRQASQLNVPIMIADNGRDFKVSPELSLNRLKSPISHISDYGSTLSAENDAKEKDTGGALVAIASALQSIASLTDKSSLENKYSFWLMVISCDSLIPATDLWHKLQSSIAQSRDKSVICIADEMHLYPLLGLYRLSVESDLRAYIDSGERQVMKFIKPKVQTVPLSKSWQHLTNFNTPEEFKQACAALNDS